MKLETAEYWSSLLPGGGSPEAAVIIRKAQIDALKSAEELAAKLDGVGSQVYQEIFKTTETLVRINLVQEGLGERASKAN